MEQLVARGFFAETQNTDFGNINYGFANLDEGSKINYNYFAAGTYQTTLKAPPTSVATQTS